MPIYGTFPYIPLLEGHAGKVYLTNNDSLALQYRTGRVGNTVAAQQALSNGVLAFSPDSDAAYQGRLTIGYNGVNTRTELQYNGTNWAPTMSDNFYLAPVLRDVSYVNASNQFDVHQFTPWHPNPGDLDVYGQRSGGSDYRVYIWALGTPEVASISPSVLPADGATHIITVTLKRRLHSSQNPYVVASIPQGTVSIDPNIRPITNSMGQITGWNIFATANNQPDVTATLFLTITESMTYLKDDVIVTETVTHLNNVAAGTFLIQGTSVAAPVAVKSASINAAVFGDGGVEGYLANGTMMGGLTVRVQLTSGINFGPGGIVVPVRVVAKPTGSNTREIIGNAALNGGPIATLDGLGNTLYQQDYFVVVDTTSTLRAHPRWDIGYEVSTPQGQINNWFGTYVNGNLTTNLPAYTLYARFGTEVYQGSIKGDGTFSWDTNPTSPLKGLVQFYLSENWNTSDQGVAMAPSYLEYRVDADPFAPTSFSDTAQMNNILTGRSEVARHFATLDTTSWTNGNHTIDWKLYRDYEGSNTRQLHEGSVAFATDQSGAGGMVPSFVVSTYGALPGPYDKNTFVTIMWDIKATSVNQFTGAVAWSVTGLPAGSGAVFTPATGNLLSDGVITTNFAVAAPTAIVGSYPLTIHAVSGGEDQTCNVTLTVIDTGTAGGGGGCVPAGTMFSTAAGPIPAEQIKIGDTVVAFNDVNLHQFESKVTKVFTYPNRELYRITTDAGQFICSHDHRLTRAGTVGLDYPPARDLKAGDRIMRFVDGELVRAHVASSVSMKATDTVYHVQLEDGHVFVAGGYLAHNMKSELPIEL